jgi:O-antigen/teichoic acid export membrane protein
MNNSTRRAASSSVLLLLESVVRMALVAAVSLWIARHLGPSGFGVLNFASALVAVLLSVSTMGMDSTVILRLARDGDEGRVLGSALLIRLVAAVACLALCVGLAWLLRGDDLLAFEVCVVAAFSILASVPYVLDYSFKARTEALAPALARIVGTALGAAAKVACLLLGLGLLALASTLVLESLLIGAGLTLAYVLTRRRHALIPSGASGQRLRADRATVRRVLSESWPYFVSISATAAYMKIDVVLLGFLQTSLQTGIYSLSQKLSEVLYIVPVVLVDSAFPALVRRFDGRAQHVDASGQLLFDLAFGGAMLATIFAVAVVQPLVLHLFGASYGPSVDIFYIHAWSSLAIALTYARYRWLAVLELNTMAPLVTGIGLLTSTALNMLLIPTYGAAGAAVATLVAFTLSGYGLSWLFPSLRGIARLQTRALWPWGRLYRLGRSLARTPATASNPGTNAP